MKKLIRLFLPFIKYCTVGVMGTAIDLVSLYIFVEYFKLPVLLGTTFSFFLAVINNFILNKVWTFHNKSLNYRKLFIKFLLVSTMGLGLTLMSMYLLTHLLKIWYILAKAMTSLLVLTWNFLGNKIWTFRVKEKKLTILEHFAFELSIVIPAYNELNRIKKTLLLIDEYLKRKKMSAEIIVVDDGSTDGTANLLESMQKQIPQLVIKSCKINHGKGNAIREGIEMSRGKYILFTDADNSTPIEEFDKLFAKMTQEQAQIAIASRYLDNSRVQIKQPKMRIFIGRVGNFLISLFLIDGIKDTQCGFKLFEHAVAQKVFSLQKVKRFGFDMEILVIANVLGYKIVEVPVDWFNSTESRFRPIKDALITLKDLFLIKINLWSGRYLPEEV